MAAASKIEWTDASWTPVRARNKATGKVGWHCEHATTGCVNCYAESFNARLGTGLPFKPGHREDLELFLDEKTLLQPLAWKRPRMVFVCSMTDLFADFVPDAWIDRMFAVMALCPRHRFQVLTKRSKRMREYITNGPRPMRVDCEALRILNRPTDGRGGVVTWPIPNVWLGVSAERQQEADERIPDLLATPAAVRFVSLEPLLGPIEMHVIRAGDVVIDALGGITDTGGGDYRQHAKIDWVIVGGESGPDARPMHPSWARLIRDDCAAAGTPFFFKQWGAFQPISNGDWRGNEVIVNAWGSTMTPQGHRNASGGDLADSYKGAYAMRRVGKKAAGRLLDGREWNEMPRAGSDPPGSDTIAPSATEEITA